MSTTQAENNEGLDGRGGRKGGREEGRDLGVRASTEGKRETAGGRREVERKIFSQRVGEQEEPRAGY